jgi:uridine kinase
VNVEAVIAAIGTRRPRSRTTRIVAVDGCGGAGKSTLARAIADAIAAVTIVPLDAFARPRQPGWEWERLKHSVLDPLDHDETGRYQRHDWELDVPAEWHAVPPGGVVVVEGVTAMTFALGPYWDLAVWVECPAPTRLARGVARDGESMRRRWTDVWMPWEDAYVREERPRERADLVVDGGGPPTRAASGTAASRR